MNPPITEMNWSESRKMRVQRFLEETKFPVITVDTLKALGNLLDAEIKDKCGNCECHEAGWRCYEYINDNPPERWCI